MRILPLVLLTAIAAGAPLASSAKTHRPLKRPPEPDNVVQIDAGQIRGAPGDGVVAFLGVPYAQPPVGDLRWRAPQPVTPWSGVLAADKFGPSCMQPDNVPKSEDCLTLNVWRPNARSNQPLPVMVWIHGGALLHGGTATSPGDALARQGVVVVSMNYRLGRLGFFAHPALAAEAPAEVRADFGYLDQIAALQWVQRNVKAFGGDPNQVTIFGDASDGGSLLVHLTSPMSHGLFQRAMLQSPDLPAARPKAPPLTDLDEAERRGVEYALSLGITGDKTTTLKQLRALPAARLTDGASVEAVFAALAKGAYVDGVTGPILDGRLLLEPPEATLAARRQAPTPVIVLGAQDRDLAAGSATSKDALFSLFGDRAEDARRLYDPQGDQPLDGLKQQVLVDAIRVEPARRLADELARAGEPTWLYRFSYTPPQPRRRRARRAVPVQEASYVFDVAAAVAADRTAPNDGTADTTRAYWMAFQRTGDPNGPGRPKWPPYDPAGDKTPEAADSGATAAPDPRKARLDLWRAVYDQGDAPVSVAAKAD